jgi:hypothetical protein
MNAKNGALDPVPTTIGVPCLRCQKKGLDRGNAVIHGLFSGAELFMKIRL